MGYVVINAEICKGCELCIEACNRGALAVSEEANSKGYMPAKLAKPEQCNGCTLCAIMCPDVAISVYK
ncbi:MAG TPA: 4Fe-4S dicluster domain-containing protein [Symbiobacteriaceae bacterium]|jgi:2-oxoglutarate ferredoxin oxidoreductase subunit delta